ncbi:MAG: class I SAM-dependent methyltransferase [Chloroflexi bacterium]|nr:class I SAM-dependent methyltransferase [Chloroflexota bacterium]
MQHQAFPETPDIETSSDGYARRFSGAVGAWFLRVQEDATLDMLSPYIGGSVLDLGGGHGQLTGALVSGGYSVTVLGSAEVCGNRVQRFVDGGLCSFHVGNLLELPYPEGAFDVAIGFRLISHVVQWEQLVSEMARVARKAIVIDYPSTKSLNYFTPLLFKLKKRLEGNTRDYISFNEGRLFAEFGAHGYLLRERYPQFFLPMFLHRAVKSPAISSGAEKPFRKLGLTRLFGSPVIAKFVREEG